MKSAGLVLKLDRLKRNSAKALDRTCGVDLDVDVAEEEAETAVEIGEETIVVESYTILCAIAALYLNQTILNGIKHLSENLCYSGG